MSRHPIQPGWLLPLSTAAMMGGILLGRALLSWRTCVWAALALFVLCAWVSVSHGLREWRRISLPLFFVAVGTLLGYPAYHPPIPAEGTHVVTGVVADEISRREDGQVKTILRNLTVDDEAVDTAAYWSYYQSPNDPLPDGLTPGARIRVEARVYAPQEADTPGGFSFKAYLLQRNVAFGLYGLENFSVLEERAFSLRGLAAHLRHEWSRGLMDVLGEDAGAYAAAVVLGNKTLLSDETIAAFENMGLSHILAVSGFHVSILIGMLMALTRWIPRNARIFLLAPALLFYCLLTGATASVIRAVTLALLYQYGRGRHHQLLPLHLLCASAIVQLSLAPAQLTGASFQLSYGAMLGITLAFPWLKARCPFSRPSLRQIWDACCLAVSAQLGVLGPQLYWFGEFPLLSLPFNVLFTWLMGSLMILFWGMLFLLPFPTIATAIGGVLGQTTSRLLSLLRALSQQAGMLGWTRRADLLVLFGWAMLLISPSVFVARRHRLRRGLFAVSLAMVLTVFLPIYHPDPTYIQFSEGEADAALIWDDELVVAVDAGEDGQTLANYLHQRRLSVDVLVLTHLHNDHAGGITALAADRIPVGVCCIPVRTSDDDISEETLTALETLVQRGTRLITLQRGDVLPLPNGSLTILWPDPALVSEADDANTRCLVLRADILGHTMLLTGDLDGKCEMNAAARADLLKVAHHGSKSSTSAAFVAAVQPEALILSCGKAAREASIAARFPDLPLYSTYSRGSVEITFYPDRYEITTYKAP